MENSKWQANKIGLINFWYYDEQEFCFADGRMLLRGSNGSGKSVTMQSVIPLLLDGNMSPERLDPFGSRDRKMSSYLLEDEDEREERTGYLYLEFKRSDSDTFLTLGMGLRARKRKPMDKWYFYISDGRRINKDFFLYKELDEKVTLTRKELEYRLREGGGVFDRQIEYMEYVNRQIFGFETVDEYKEMIDLLIQLRTPKLSKDFKPSVINDILSDSLQALSDDDLRPMSEAIENMDTTSMNLKSKQESRQAAEKIRKVYEQYNYVLLYQKAADYARGIRQDEKLKSEMEENVRQIGISEKKISVLSKQYQTLEIEQVTLDKEKESLNASDAVYLKKQEGDLQERIKQNQQNIQEKEKQLVTKEEQYVQNRYKQKKQEEQQEIKRDELLSMMDEMSEYAELMGFQEHAFLCDDLKNNLESTYSFDTHMLQAGQWKKKLEEGVEILREADEKRRRLDEGIKLLDGCRRDADVVERRVAECRMLCAQAQNEYKESIYEWSGRNQELILEQEILRMISSYADRYGDQSDYGTVRQLVADCQISKKEALSAGKHAVTGRKKEVKEKLDSAVLELREWETAKEPEPPRSEAVLRSRMHLKEMGIPYLEFYKVIEFDAGLSAEKCNYLEEALLDMGILDALVIDEEYREKVMTADQGMSDRYLFVQKQRASKSLLDLFNVNEEMNDLFFNQRIIRILENIGYDSEDSIAVYPDGRYRMGVINGTITKDHEAEFIGVHARERSRQAKIAALKDECRQFEEQLQELEAEILKWDDRLRKLQQEYNEFPSDQDLHAAWRLKDETNREWERLLEEVKRLEVQVNEMTAAMQEIWKQAAALAEKLYLPCVLERFLEAKTAAEEYWKQLYELKGGHFSYIQMQVRVEELREVLDNLDLDMDTLRYDEGKYRRTLLQEQEELNSIQQQLSMTNYEEIRERLDYCMNRLMKIPKEKESCVQESTALRAQIGHMQEALAAQEKLKVSMADQIAFLKAGFEQERRLGYVEVKGDTPQEAVESLEERAGSFVKEDILARLNQVYFENRGFLTEYQLTQTPIFEELEVAFPEIGRSAKRMDMYAKFRGIKVSFLELLKYLDEEILELNELLRAGDRELFEDILANTISRKIRSKMNASFAWVEKMNKLMGAMNTSSGLKLSLRLRSKTAENENQLDTSELVKLLKKDYRVMRDDEAERLSAHFRSKVEEARRGAKDSNGMISFYGVMRETLDYRKWFEFQLFFQKSGEKVKELTNSVFGTFSGGEKAMSMYVPLFSAVVAKYKGAREDAPRMISLDEAFAGVDNRNIRDMFRLMMEFDFNFIINSQVLWGDCDTLNTLAIYQLLRPENAKFVTVMPYLWNGKIKELIEDEHDMEERAAGM